MIDTNDVHNSSIKRAHEIVKAKNEGFREGVEYVEQNEVAELQQQLDAAMSIWDGWQDVAEDYSRQRDAASKKLRALVENVEAICKRSWTMNPTGLLGIRQALRTAIAVVSEADSAK